MSGFSVEIRALLMTRAGGVCELCAVPADNVHHRHPRRMGGTRMGWVNWPSNGLVLCGSGTTGCHGYFESHRTEAIARGIILPTGSVPWETPVWMRKAWWLLDDVGGAHRVVLPQGHELIP